MAVIKRYFLDVVQDRFAGVQEKLMRGDVFNFMDLLGDVMSALEGSEFIYRIIVGQRDPTTGEGILYEGLTEAYVQEHLTVPMLMDFCKKFVTINQLEEFVKNLSALPLAKEIGEYVKTVGLSLTNSYLLNMASLPERLPEAGPIPSSSSTSTPSSSERPEAPIPAPAAGSDTVQ